MTKLCESSHNYLNLFIMQTDCYVRSARKNISRLYRFMIKYCVIYAIKVIKNYLQTIKEVVLFKIGLKAIDILL